MPEMFICVPEDYYSFKMQNFINVSCADPAKQWIYNVIQDKPASSEIVLHRDRDWTLCRDGNMSDGKWLVVLHDMSLKSLRDLRGKHVVMLRSIQSTVNGILSTHYSIDNLKTDFFIHYFPSVFQLHIHVHLRDKRLAQVHGNLQPNNVVDIRLSAVQVNAPLQTRQPTRQKQRDKERGRRNARTGPVHDCFGDRGGACNQCNCNRANCDCDGCKDSIETDSTDKHSTDNYYTDDYCREVGVGMQARHGLCLSRAAQMFTSGRHHEQAALTAPRRAKPCSQ